MIDSKILTPKESYQNPEYFAFWKNEIRKAVQKAGTIDVSMYKSLALAMDGAFVACSPKEIRFENEQTCLVCDNMEFILESTTDPYEKTVLTDFFLTALKIDSSTPEAFDKWKHTNRPAFIVGTREEDWMFLTLHEARCYANAKLVNDSYVVIEKVNWNKTEKARLKDYEDAVGSFLDDASSVTRGIGLGFECYIPLMYDSDTVFTGPCTGIGLLASLTEDSFAKDWKKKYPKYRIEGKGLKGTKSYIDICILSESDEDRKNDLDERIYGLGEEWGLTDITYHKLP